jgi:hypothetical protein
MIASAAISSMMIERQPIRDTISARPCGLILEPENKAGPRQSLPRSPSWI